VGNIVRPRDARARVSASLDRTGELIYRLLQICDYGKIDFRITPEGRIYFLEANPNPELSPFRMPNF
jgi:D-alanine-D-alanine ligase